MIVRKKTAAAMRWRGSILPKALAAVAIITLTAGSLILPGDASIGRVSGAEATAAQVHTFPVTIQVDKTITEYRVEPCRVRDLLKNAGIQLGEHDKVNFPLYEWVEPNASIVVERREYRTAIREEIVPCTIETIPTSLLTPGKTRELLPGKDGLLVTAYSQLWVDGEMEEEEITFTWTESEPINGKMLLGENRAAISPLSFEEYKLDENGVPMQYAEVLQNQRAAGYSAKPGAGTASGRKAAVGHVAVDPNVIPYGSKLYIQSTDGRFVYGYAIAADTGIALKDGRIAVDLFYGSYLESALNGIRQVDIYILEKPQ